MAMTDQGIDVGDVNEDDVVDIDEEASDLEKAQALVGIEAGDPLQALLEWDTAKPVTDIWHSKRLGVTFTYGAFQDDKAYERVVDRATHYVRRRGGNRQKELDQRQFSKLIVIDRVLNPPFSPDKDSDGFKRLAAHYGSEDPEVLVGRALLPGEIDALADRILTLSGYDDDLEATAGN